MGRSSSCFKIITCGSDSQDGDEIDVIESKDSKDKRGWSFRKRSSQHRVLNNTVITEISSGKKNIETAVIDFQPPANSIDPEKPTVIHFTNEQPRNSTDPEKTTVKHFTNDPPADSIGQEKTTVIHLTDENIHGPNSENPKESDNTHVLSKNTIELDGQVEEPVIIVIQAGIRGFLAQRAMIKIKNVVKIQAAVRGFLVRRHAVGTLRCVQAIVKMQNLVRARRSHLSSGGSTPNKLYIKDKEENPGSNVMGEQSKPELKYISIEKLLSNSFAQQLLESEPRNRPINIKCDPSKHDSAWKWLERWMAVSSLDNLEPKKVELTTEQMVIVKEESHVEDGIDSDTLLATGNLSSYTNKSVLPSGSEDLTTHDVNNLQDQICDTPSLSIGNDMDQPQSENDYSSEVKETSTEVSSILEQRTQLDEGLQSEVSSISEKLEAVVERANPLKRSAPEQVETEGKKYVIGSRKASNPSFITAQAKFERLTSVSDTVVMTSSAHQDGVDPHSITVTSKEEPDVREPSTAENSVLPESRIIQVGGFESGTELSISSTLDSPDESEAGELADARADNISKIRVEVSSEDQNTAVEVKDSLNISMENDLQVPMDHSKNISNSNGHSTNSAAIIDSTPSESKPEKKSSSDLQGELHSDMSRQAYRSSPEASPRSHLTVLESQGTPSSQVSIKAKRDKTGKTESYKKQKSLSAGKKSPSSINRNSGTRNSAEQLQKDQKNAKRRNSFDSARPDHIEQELRESSSNSSIPHFMQATKSARAKVHTNSPRSSPDVQDREMYLKKRHSLPVDGRQGSPRVQEPISRAQQGGAKGNEKMWRR